MCGGICDVVEFVTSTCTVVLLISKIMTSWRVRSLLLLLAHMRGPFSASEEEEGSSPTPYDGWQVSAVVNHSAWLYRAAFFLICEPCAKMPGTPKRHWTQAVANNSLEVRIRQLDSFFATAEALYKLQICTITEICQSTEKLIYLTMIIWLRKTMKHWPSEPLKIIAQFSTQNLTENLTKFGSGTDLKVYLKTNILVQVETS